MNESPDSKQTTVKDSPATIRTDSEPYRSSVFDGLRGGGDAEAASSAPPVRRLKLFWPATCAVCVGITVVISGGFEYCATARFAVSGSLPQIRASLLDFLWQREQQLDTRSRWSVEAPKTGGELELILQERDENRAKITLRKLAGDFEKHIGALSRQEQESDAEIQALFQRLIADFQLEVHHARIVAREGSAKVPDHSPFDKLLSLSDRLTANLRILEALRTLEENVQTRIQRLGADSLPSKSVISSELRRAAYAARIDLQQDIKQLALQLTLGRRCLEEVWQNASPRLDDLISAAARLYRVGFSSGGGARGRAPADRLSLDPLTDAAGLYQRRLSAFAENWMQIFTRMRQQPVEPQAPRLMSIQSRLHHLLGDFQFHSGKLIDRMRDELRALAERTDARHHVQISEAKRLFHRLESDHRQFEFVSSDVFCRNNFRLDSAMKSATGLHRRVQRVTHEIDAQLQAETLQRIKAERLASRTGAVAEWEGIRREIDVEMDQIIKLFAEYSSTVPLAEGYLRPSLSFEAARHRVADAERRLAAYRSIVEVLQERHRSDREPLSIKLIECSVERRRSGFAWRVVYGLFATGLTLAGVTFFGRRLRGVPWA